MRPISSIRYNALAGYCRSPDSILVSEELAWFEHGDERVLGAVIRDRIDNDFAGVVLGRDKQGRFRWIYGTEFDRTQRRAEVLLRRHMERLAMAPDEEYHQGDESAPQPDFFHPRVAKSKLHPGFLALTEQEGFSPAMGIIKPMMAWFVDPDGNFVEQFQSTGFNSRIWELYLFSAFVEMGCSIDRSQPAPDFSCTGILGEFYVEAVTVNPTQDEQGNEIPPPPFRTSKEKDAYLNHFMPIKYGSSLTTKLGKKYWEKPHLVGKPLVFAIHDFSYPMSMTFTRPSLPIYLYGYDANWVYDAEGCLKIIPYKIKSHNWEGKEIPSGFFDLPGAENVSAVIFSNSATISKFNRMGVLAGFGSPRVQLVREGYVLNHDPNVTKPDSFRKIVNEPGYTETWVEGMEVYHNPRAKYPLDPILLPGAGHHNLLSNGQIESFAPKWHPLSSVTHNFLGVIP